MQPSSTCKRVINGLHRSNHEFLYQLIGQREHMLSYFKTKLDHPTLKDPQQIDQLYSQYRRSTFLSIFIGYSFFYTTRLSMSVGKEAMISAQVVDAQQLGLIGSGFFFAYAIGKFFHGFLSDRVHIGRLMSWGLLCSACCNLLFSWQSSLMMFVTIWTLNGWFQSTGSAPSGTNISHWFSQGERGKVYSIWSMAQNLGEVISFLLVTYVIIHYSWQASFYMPALICIVIALIIHFTIKDRPIAYGLPPIEQYKEAQKQDEKQGKQHEQDHANALGSSSPSLVEMTSVKKQLSLLTSMWLWLLGIACACMYVCRYAMTNWLVLYLQKAKGYDLVNASFCLSAFSLAGILGTVLAGPLSDVFFQGRRGAASFSYALILCVAFIGLFLLPTWPYSDYVFSIMAGFAIGGLLVFLGGLIAIDLSPAHATGAALGLIGCFSYLGAGLQEIMSGYLIHAQSTGNTMHFTSVIMFWSAASLATLALVTILWKKYHI